MSVLDVDAPRRGSDFAPLLRAVRARGLLHTRRGRYTALIATDLAAFAGVWAGVYVLGSTWWTLFLAVPAALFSARVIFIGHDVGHHQVARTARGNRWMGVIFGDLITGIGARWWIDKHTRHHANPNVVGRDPDVDPGALIWTSAQAADRRSRGGRWLAANQARLYFPMLLLEALNLKVASFRSVRSVRDLLPLCVHVCAYVGGLLLVMGPGRTAVFIAAHQALLGLHLGCAFAPNHKGMLMPEVGGRPDFLRKQVLTSRNVTGGPVTDWFFGGLNLQIEHHLFPSMPRPNLRRVRPMVRDHCAALGVCYAEENLRSSFGLTVSYLHGVARQDAPAHSAV